MAKRIPTFACLLLCLLSVSGYCQDDRKIVSKVAPAYPSIARDMRISGSVKVEAVVAPNGSVKLVDIKGGHPILAQAAADAVSKWKWEPAKAESREPVELKFMPVQ